jgi:hypothetical protein
MKLCKDCVSSKKEGIETPQGWKTILFCANDECREPVNGDMLPCEITRREQVFCGIQAKHFMQKEEPKPTPLLEIAK